MAGAADQSSTGCQRHGRLDCDVCFEEAVGIRGPASFPWRTGRKVGRTIYMCRYEPGDLIGGRASGIVIASDDDPLIGVMDTPELASEAVNAHNARLGFGQSSEQSANAPASAATNQEERRG